MHEDQRSDGSMWDRRFAETVYAYGKEPNAWLKACIGELAPEPNPAALFPADGEGRNAVWAASEGWSASVFDLSVEGKKSVSNLLASTEYRSTMTWTISWLETSQTATTGSSPARGFTRLLPSEKSTCRECCTPLHPEATL